MTGCQPNNFRHTKKAKEQLEREQRKLQTRLRYGRNVGIYQIGNLI
jgi:hypothetical protein